MFPSIHRLSEDVVNSISSGASLSCITSAIQMALENSVDSGASEIIIWLDSHKRGFTLADNGSGMNYKDLACLGLPNYTSKLTNLEDITSLHTYGFRGRSIFEISKVGRVKAVTKSLNEPCAWRKIIDGAIERAHSNDALPFQIGTTVTVTDFFHNLPLRLKSLESTPLSCLFERIRLAVFDVLVSHPNLHISVYSRDQDLSSLIFDSPSTPRSLPPLQKLSMSFFGVFNINPESHRIKPIHARYANYNVEGFISDFLTHSKDLQLLYVNGVRFKDRRLFRPVAKAFSEIKTHLNNTNSAGRHIIFVLKVSVPKTTPQDSVKHMSLNQRHCKIIHSLIFKLLNEAFKLDTNAAVAISGESRRQMPNSGLEPNNKENGVSTLHPRSLTDSVRPSSLDSFHISKRLKKCADRSYHHKNEFLDIDAHNSQHEMTVAMSKDIITNPRNTFNQSFLQNFSSEHILNRTLFSSYRAVNQVDNSFILLKSTAKSTHSPQLLLVDQHAADERMRFESLMSDFLYEFITAPYLQTLSTNIEFTVTSREYQYLGDYKREFQLWGVNYRSQENPKSQITITINSVPGPLKDKSSRAIKSALLQHADDLKHSRKTSFPYLKGQDDAYHPSQQFAWWKYLNAMPNVLIDFFKSKACRSAIMFGDVLSMQECNLLVEMLGKCRNPFFCAHGRPSVAPLASINAHSHEITSNQSVYEDYTLDNDCNINC